jgi:O-antigen/teichoic acid export membrane protein
MGILAVSLLKNTAWGLLGELAVRGVKIAQIILLARVLGAEDIGRFNYALALAGLFTVFFDFGVTTIAVRELARNPDAPVLRLFGRVKLLSSTIGLALVAATTMLSSMSADERHLAFGLGLYLALNDFSTYLLVAYRARQEFWRETLWRTAFSILQLSACVAALFLTRQLEWIVAALVGAATLGLLPLWREWSRQPMLSKCEKGIRRLGQAIGECAPVAGSVLIGTVYMNLDVVVLGNTASMQEVGLYSIAVKTIFSLLIMPLHYFQLATLPLLAASSYEDARSRWLRAFVTSTTVGALLNLGTAMVAAYLLSLVFGTEFAAAGPILVTFSLIGFLFYLHTPMAQLLLLQGKQRWTLYIHALAAAMNVALVLVLIPRWGLWGAVLTAGATHAFIALGHFVAVWHIGGFSRRERGWWSLVRVALGLALGIGALEIGIQGELAPRAAAAVLFLVVAYPEIVALAQSVRTQLRSHVATRPLAKQL